MKTAEYIVLSAELKDRPQGAGQKPRAKVLNTIFTQHWLNGLLTALSTQY
ncbi:hypothetical protein [Nostoc sp.]